MTRTSSPSHHLYRWSDRSRTARDRSSAGHNPFETGKPWLELLVFRYQSWALKAGELSFPVMGFDNMELQPVIQHGHGETHGTCIGTRRIIYFIWRAAINCHVIRVGSPFISACFPTLISDIPKSVVWLGPPVCLMGSFRHFLSKSPLSLLNSQSNLIKSPWYVLPISKKKPHSEAEIINFSRNSSFWSWNHQFF